MAGAGPIGVPISAELKAAADVMIDFSVAAAADRVIETCLARKLPLVSATTGLSDEQTARLLAAAEQIPLLVAPNMSLAVNLTMKLTQVAADALPRPGCRRRDSRTAPPLQRGFAQRDGA